MKRRTFNKLITRSSLFLVVKPAISLHAGLSSPMDRIGMSTVNFRNRFPATRSTDAAAPGRDMTLLDIPEYFRDRFQLQHVELWSKHFESTEKSYLKTLRSALKKAKSKLINIQLDESYQLGDPDPLKRRQGLELVLRWVDAAKTLGSRAIRVNPGRGDLGHVIEGLRTINAAARRNKLILMTENHFGMEMDPEVHLRIVNEVGNNMYTLPDYGNYSDAVRYEALKKIMPYAYQMSAKTVEFDEKMNHITFDFEKCMDLARQSGFQGIYSVEQWSPGTPKVSDEAMADWMIEKVKPYCI